MELLVDNQCIPSQHLCLDSASTREDKLILAIPQGLERAEQYDLLLAMEIVGTNRVVVVKVIKVVSS